MAQFSYKALAADGTMRSGAMNAADRGEALRSLSKKGLRPVKVEAQEKEQSDSKAVKKSKKPLKKSSSSSASPKKSALFASKTDQAPDGPIKLKKQEVILFTEELSDMLTAGLQLEPALRSMEQRQDVGNLKHVSERVRSLVRDGNSFSKSLNRVSPSFGPLYCSMAAAGEASGALDIILKKQCDYLKTINELQNTVTLALIYPAFLLVAGVGVSVIFVTKLIPQLTSLLENTPGATIPKGAQILIALSDFFSAYWWIILLIIVISGISFKVWKEVEENKPTWDRIKLKLPMVGSVVEQRFYVQFLETMANLVGNGLTLLRSLELTRDATQNLHLKENLNGVIDQVGDGRSLSSALIRAKVFPALLIDMVSVGEQTGKIDQSLAKAANRYDKELNNSLKKIMAIIMPAVLIVMALMIGAMAYLMLTAIFQTVETLGVG